MTKPRPIDVEALYTAARELRDLLPRVAALIPNPENGHTDGDARSTTVVYRIPWHGPAANAFFDVRAGARTHLSALTLLLHHHAKYVGESDAATLEAIGRIPILVDHAIHQGHQDDDVVQEAAKALRSWPRACRRVLDELRDDEQDWTHAPGKLVCPHCEQRLELRPGWTDRRHADPGAEDLYCRTCRDEHGHYLRWPPGSWIGVLQDIVTRDAPIYDTDGVELITTRQAANRHNLDPSTVRVWAHRGHLTAHGRHPQSGAYLYRVTDVQARIIRV